MLGWNREASEGERMRGRRGCVCTQSQQAGEEEVRLAAEESEGIIGGQASRGVGGT